MLGVVKRVLRHFATLWAEISSVLPYLIPFSHYSVGNAFSKQKGGLKSRWRTVTGKVILQLQKILHGAKARLRTTDHAVVCDT